MFSRIFFIPYQYLKLSSAVNVTLFLVILEGSVSPHHQNKILFCLAFNMHKEISGYFCVIHWISHTLLKVTKVTMEKAPRLSKIL